MEQRLDGLEKRLSGLQRLYWRPARLHRLDWRLTGLQELRTVGLQKQEAYWAAGMDAKTAEGTEALWATEMEVRWAAGKDASWAAETERVGQLSCRNRNRGQLGYRKSNGG